MLTLLARYLAKPTRQNAERVRVYERRHMMSTCLLAGDYLALAVLDEALALANGANSAKAA